MSLIDEIDPRCPRGCGRTMDDCHEAEDGDECAGSELLQRLQRELAEARSVIRCAFEAGDEAFAVVAKAVPNG